MKKVALVTGGNRGIGFAISLELAKNGWTVVIVCRSDAKAIQQAIKKIGGKSIFYQKDISNSEYRKEIVETVKKDLGRIDVLVNNAGVVPEKRMDVLEASEESFDKVININLKAPYFLTQLVAKWMIELVEKDNRIKPVIINISSISSYTSSTSRGEYCISKAGISMMTKLYADRLAEHNISVFEIRPGIIATDMTKNVKDKYDKLIEEGVTPIKRWGTPGDVAKAVLSIVKGCFPFSTGEVINVDGGFHLRRL